MSLYQFVAVCVPCGFSRTFDVRDGVAAEQWSTCPDCGVPEKAVVGTPRALRELGIDVDDGVVA